MDCERIQDLLSGSLDGSLSESDREGVAAHLRECRPCRAAADGLKDTLDLLRHLPSEQAPPELIEGVRRGIAKETSRRPLRRRLLLPAHVKIPLEAAAAVVLFLLVYGSLKQQAPTTALPPRAAQVESPAPLLQGEQAPGARGGTTVRAPSEPLPAERRRNPEAAASGVAVRGDGTAVSRAGADPARHPVPVRIASAAPEGESALRETGPARPPVRDSLPAVPAQRVSTAGERIGPDARAEEPAAPGIFPAPPARLARVLPFGREVTIEVNTEDRPGLEERIASAARRVGGAAQPEPAPEEAAPAMRVHVPRASAEPFLAELRKLGTLPSEEASGPPGAPAGLSPEFLVYRVRIRVR